MRSILNSPYLSFSYGQFANDNNPLVIMGHSLGENDNHIVEAIGKRTCPVAISIYSVNESDTIRKKASFIEKLPKQVLEKKLMFYDATTHPLGSANLKVQD